jgi:hypothetical protein
MKKAMEATKEKTATTQEVADRFYELAQQGKFDEIQDELYDENVRSVEPAHSNWQNVQGLDKIKEKGKQWQEMTEEMHGGYTGKPQVAGTFFSCVMGLESHIILSTGTFQFRFFLNERFPFSNDCCNKITA